MIKFKDQKGFWKTKTKIVDEVRNLEADYELALDTLRFIATNSTAPAIAAKKTLEIIDHG